jgi:hypothetical protein
MVFHAIFNCHHLLRITHRLLLLRVRGASSGKRQHMQGTRFSQQPSYIGVHHHHQYNVDIVDWLSIRSRPRCQVQNSNSHDLVIKNEIKFIGFSFYPIPNGPNSLMNCGRAETEGRQIIWWIMHSSLDERDKSLGCIQKRNGDRERDWTGNSLFKVICHFISCCCCSQDPKDVRPLTHSSQPAPSVALDVSSDLLFF